MGIVCVENNLSLLKWRSIIIQFIGVLRIKGFFAKTVSGNRFIPSQFGGTGLNWHSLLKLQYLTPKMDMSQVSPQLRPKHLSMAGPEKREKCIWFRKRLLFLHSYKFSSIKEKLVSRITWSAWFERPWPG